MTKESEVTHLELNQDGIKAIHAIFFKKKYSLELSRVNTLSKAEGK